MTIKDKFTNGSFLSLYIIVMIVSLISSVQFFEISHETWMSWLLAVGFELGAACCLIGVITNKKNIAMIYVMLVVLTLFQMMANVFAAYTNLSDAYRDWTTLFFLEDLEDLDKRRIISFISGAILPVVALGFVHILASNLEKKEEVEEKPEEIKEEPQDEDHQQPEPPKKEETKFSSFKIKKVEPKEIKEEPVIVEEPEAVEEPITEEPKEEIKEEPEVIEEPIVIEEPKEEIKEEPEVVEEPIVIEEPKEEIKAEPEVIEEPKEEIKEEPVVKTEPEKKNDITKSRKYQDELWMNTLYNRF